MSYLRQVLSSGLPSRGAASSKLSKRGVFGGSPSSKRGKSVAGSAGEPLVSAAEGKKKSQVSLLLQSKASPLLKKRSS